MQAAWGTMHVMFMLRNMPLKMQIFAQWEGLVVALVEEAMAVSSEKGIPPMAWRLNGLSGEQPMLALIRLPIWAASFGDPGMLLLLSMWIERRGVKSTSAMLGRGLWWSSSRL